MTVKDALEAERRAIRDVVTSAKLFEKFGWRQYKRGLCGNVRELREKEKEVMAAYAFENSVREVVQAELAAKKEKKKG